MGTLNTGRPADEHLASFLRFIDRDIQQNPKSLRPLDESLSRQIATLVDGIEVEMREDLGPAIEL